MGNLGAADLDRVSNFEQLVDLLRDKLEWPIGEDYGFDDIVFEYEASELGLKKDETAKIREIHQLRPLATDQPWGIFFISMEDKAIPVTVLRRILKALVVKKRSGAQTADRRAWDKSDLIFAASLGKSGARELAFIHFSDGRTAGDLPVMKVLGWNAQDTVLKHDYVATTLRDKLVWPDDPENTEAWRTTWASAFELRLNQVIKTSKDLAIRLADLASDIRARVNQLLEAEDDTGPMRSMHAAFRKNLIHDLDDDGFADMFAQTIAYGLLAASISRLSDDGRSVIVADNLADMVPRTNPFLKELFGNFLKIGGRDRRSGLDFDELGIRDIVDALNNADMAAVLRDFGDRNPREDPVIHFYELFLKEYDPKKRIQRGVFYTPRPVVNFIVRGVDEVLQTEFGLPLGLADTSTWAEVAARNDRITIPAHVQPDAPFVQILDPATGTGTFLVEVIELIHKRMEEHWKAQGKSAAEIKAAWNEYVPNHLLPRLTAFELMMAPYTIAHMKVGLKLSETGYTFGSAERTRIFLTNALEPARDVDMEFDFMSEALANEALAANAAKAETSFTIIVGNPPYSNFSSNLTEQAKTFIERVRLFEGVKIKERNQLQFERNINDDYVKFFALCMLFASRSVFACLGLITNSTFLRSDSLKGLREWQEEGFGVRRVVDLHGASVRGSANVATDDQNVFDIEQPVSISLFSNNRKGKKSWKIYDLQGQRARKYDWLFSARAICIDYHLLRSNSSGRLLPVNSLRLNEEYSEYTGLDDLQGLFSEAIKTGRDWLVTDFDAHAVLRRMSEIQQSNLNNDELVDALSINVKKAWNFSKARAAIQGKDLGKYVLDIDYRPFDRRKIFFHKNWISSPALPVMQHFAQGCNNFSLLVARKSRSEVANLYWCSDTISDKGYCSSVDNVSSFPLWLSTTSGESFLRPNIDREWAIGFGENAGLTYEDGIPRGGQRSFGSDLQRSKAEQFGLLDTPWDGRGDLTDTFGPRDLFDYIYAVLHSPGYRSRYAEFLKSDFPRIPTPKDLDTFAELVLLGRDLVALHLLRTDEAPILEKPIVRFAGSGDARVEKGFPKYENGKVLINGTRWFEDVPKDTWEFHVGGYQVCQKWLKDRAGKGAKNPSPGRILTDNDILHYRRVIVALTETRRLMAEIDKVIEKHGGWPGAFYQPPPPPPSVEEIIKADESRELEFKSTFQWDMREGRQHKHLQEQVLKTLAAFMNSDGGTLVIGVTDDKEIIGLEHDLKLVKGSLDAFENTLMNVFSSAIGAPYSMHCKMRFVDAQDGKKVCVIDVAAAKEPVFVDFQGSHKFYIRRGNATVSLNASEQHAYTRQRFKG